MKRVALSFGSVEQGTKILRGLADELEQRGVARAEFIDEDSVDGSPLQIDLTNEDSDDFEIPTAIVEERDY